MYLTLGYSMALRGWREDEAVAHVDEDNSLRVMGFCVAQAY